MLAVPEQLRQEIKGRIDKKVRHKNGSLTHMSRGASGEMRAILKRAINAAKLDSAVKSSLQKTTDKLITSLSKSGHRAGVDCTFSAPKSVSLAALVGDRSELLEAHKKAVDYALDYLEKECVGTRIGRKDNRVFARTGNLVAAKFLHGTSREGDPQLHTHCVVLSMTSLPDDKWRSVHNDEIYKNSKLVGVIYQNKLAELVQKMGYEIEVKPKGTFELKGYSAEQLQGFSKRRSQVLENTAKMLYEKTSADYKRQHSFAEKRGELINQATQKLNRSTVKKDRRVKKDLDRSSLKKKWKTEEAEMLVQHPSLSSDKSIFGSKIDSEFSIEHLSERDALMKERDIKIAAVSKNLGRQGFDSIIEETFKSKNMVETINPSLKTSIHQVNLEKKILEMVKPEKGDFRPLSSSAWAHRQALKNGFTKGQTEALNLALTTKEQFLIWNGVAGSGKTTALKQVREIAGEKGWQLLAMAPDATSARVLGESLGTKSTTIHSFLQNDFAKDRKLILVVDEAGKMSTKLAHDLVEKAKNLHARVLFTGDERQLGAVESGNPIRSMIKGGVATAELWEHRRQKSATLREAVEDLSKQTGESMQRGLDRLGNSIHQRKTQEARLNVVVRKYMGLSPDEREQTLLLVDTNRDRFALTERLRDALKNEGKLDKTDHKMESLMARDLTRAELRNLENYQVGDVVISNTKLGPLQLGTQYLVASKGGGKLVLSAGQRELRVSPEELRVSVYEKNQIDVSCGDVLEWRRNHNVRFNRETVKVTKVDNDFAILKTASGSRIRISMRKPQHLEHGLVKTTYSAQGDTKDRVIALTNANLSRESLYVLASRAQRHIDIVTDDKGKLLVRASRSSLKENALDHVDLHQVELKFGKEKGHDLGLTM